MFSGLYLRYLRSTVTGLRGAELPIGFLGIEGFVSAFALQRLMYPKQGDPPESYANNPQYCSPCQVTRVGIRVAAIQTNHASVVRVIGRRHGRAYGHDKDSDTEGLVTFCSPTVCSIDALQLLVFVGISEVEILKF
jgi:hypothetical protein